MHVFITGGSGLTGPAVVSELLAGGHSVTGLARSERSAARLRALGADSHPGSLDDLDSLRAGASAADGVVHMGFGGDFADPDDLVRRDRGAIEALGEPLVGTGRPLVMTSGTFAMAPGRVSDEQDAPDRGSIAWFRIPGEEACLSLAGKDVRASAIRLAPTVHGPGDHGFIPMLVDAARRHGASAYVGDGANRWPAVHRLDAAVLFRLALERAPAGTALHGADEAGVTLRTVAEVIGERIGVPTVSVTPAAAGEWFGAAFIATAYATDAPASNARTRELLGWTPTHPTLLADLAAGDYFDAPTAATAG